MYIGQTLIEAIAVARVTQQELAEQLKMHPATINQLCRGNRQATEELVYALAAALRCDVRITVRFVPRNPPATSRACVLLAG